LAFIPAIAILAGALLPVLNRLKTADVFDLYWSGLGLGVSGIILLFSRDYRFITSIVFGLLVQARQPISTANFTGWLTQRLLPPFCCLELSGFA